MHIIFKTLLTRCRCVFSSNLTIRKKNTMATIYLPRHYALYCGLKCFWLIYCSTLTMTRSNSGSASSIFTRCLCATRELVSFSVDSLALLGLVVSLSLLIRAGKTIYEPSAGCCYYPWTHGVVDNWTYDISILYMQLSPLSVRVSQ